MRRITLILLFIATKGFAVSEAPEGYFGDGGDCVFKEIIIAVEPNGVVWIDKKRVWQGELLYFVQEIPEPASLDCILIVASAGVEEDSDIVLEIEKTLAPLNRIIYFSKDT